MIVLRSFLFGVWFWGSLAVALAHMMTLLRRPRQAMQHAVRRWSKGALWGARILLGLDYRVEGRENLPPGPVILASKHQSAWDTLVYHDLFEDTAYVLKRELNDLPVWGQCSRKCESIVVDRTGGAGALRKLIDDTARALADGRPVVIFPEGTRTPIGRRTPYHPGIAALYARAGVPVVPVALNSGLFWAKDSFRKWPGTITLKFLPPVPSGLDRRTFMRTLEDRVETETERLIARARAENPALPPPPPPPAGPAHA